MLFARFEAFVHACGRGRNRSGHRRVGAGRGDADPVRYIRHASFPLESATRDPWVPPHRGAERRSSHLAESHSLPVFLADSRLDAMTDDVSLQKGPSVVMPAPDISRAHQTDLSESSGLDSHHSGVRSVVTRDACLEPRRASLFHAACRCRSGITEQSARQQGRHRPCHYRSRRGAPNGTQENHCNSTPRSARRAGGPFEGASSTATRMRTRPHESCAPIVPARDLAGRLICAASPLRPAF